MLQSELIHPSGMSSSDRDAWRALAARAPGPASPLLGPDFADLIGRFRPDTQVAIWRDAAGRPVAFLPHHRRMGGVAFPLGAPLSDYHGPVAEAGFDISAALGEAGLSAYRFTSAIASPDAADSREGFLIELAGSPEDYLEALRAERPKSFKNYRRLGHRLEREIGPLRIVAATDPDAFRSLIDWKRQQFMLTGAYDFLRPAWIGDMLQALRGIPGPEFGGLMLTLYAGDRLVAGHFGLRAGEAYHPWIASTDPDLAVYAPGHVFLMQVIAAMPGLGLRTYDLGPSHEHYKRPYSLSSRRVVSGAVFAPGAAGGPAKVTERAWAVASGVRPGFVGRLRRRLHTIASAEPTVLGRVQSYAHSLGAVAHRNRDAKDAA